MSQPKKTLFDLVVEPSKVHPNFERLRTWEGSEPTRRMLDEIYQDFIDPDGNFLEQFQTTGFDQRYFEIYLHAYFSRSGYKIRRPHPNPDFLVTRGEVTVAVEATTVGPPTSGVMADIGRKINELSPEEIQDYKDNELPIRFGSPLFTKLQKRYWELEHCKDIPFVIAIEAFHDDESLVFTDDSLTKYAYGLSHTANWNGSGDLRIDASSIKEHNFGKVIPSNFFAQPDAEHISAILFTNCGTQAKFGRIGYQHGFGCDTVDIIRTGFSFNPDPDAMDPTFFSYSMNEPPLVETWGQGLVVLHNPNCLHPLPRDFFVNAFNHHIENGAIKSEFIDWHPFSSKTFFLHLGEIKKKVLEKFPQTQCMAVAAIHRDEFHSICGFRFARPNPFGEEQGWFCDQTQSFLGVLIQDKADGDWGYVILARDDYFEFRAIETEFNFQQRDVSRVSLQMKIAELLSHPKRIFSQG